MRPANALPLPKIPRPNLNPPKQKQPSTEALPAVAPKADAHLAKTEEIDDVKALKLQVQLSAQNNGKFGDKIWRICARLNQEKGHDFFLNNAELITQIRQLPSFQEYDPFNDKNFFLFGFVINNPWILAIFTKKQLTLFFIELQNTQSTEVIEQLKRNLTLHASSFNPADAALDFGKSLFSPGSIETSVNIQFPTLTEEQRNKKALITFLADNGIYSAAVINETVTSREFILLYGFYRELIPLLRPSTLVKLFLEFDYHVSCKFEELRESLKQRKVETKIYANLIRDSIEYRWLLTRIEADIQSILDIKTYWNEIKEVPYLFYELTIRDTFWQIPQPKLLAFFEAIEPDTILETLQLLDPEDKVNRFIYLNKKTQQKNVEQDEFEVDKSTSLSKFQACATLLVSDQLCLRRQLWAQDPKTLRLLLTYPFLFKGIDHQGIDQVLSKHKDTIFANAKICMANGINSYIHCPLLLAYPSPNAIITLCESTPDLGRRFSDKTLPEEVIIYYIRNNTYEQLTHKIPILNNYLDLEFFSKVDKKLLDEQLLLVMIFATNTITRLALKNYPSILNQFSQSAVSACAHNSIFLRQILRQNMLIQFIKYNYEDLLLRNFKWLKNIISILYRNPESEALVTTILNDLEILRKDVYTKFDQNTEKDLIDLHLARLVFDVETYTQANQFEEHTTLEDIEETIEEHKKGKDPIIFCIRPIIMLYPSWTRRLIQSDGIYPVLRQYCLKILKHSAAKLRNTQDHYRSLYAYAALLVEEKNFEDAAVCLVEYIDYLGVNTHKETSKQSTLYLLIKCADGLAKRKPKETLNYYCYAATALLAAADIKLLSQKVPLKIIESSLARGDKEQIDPALNIKKAVRRWYKMIVKFVIKSMDLIQNTKLPEKERLELLALTYELLSRTIDANHYSDNISDQASNLKKTLLMFGLTCFELSYFKLIAAISEIVKLYDNHDLRTPKNDKLPRQPKKEWKKTDQVISDQNTFLYDYLANFIRNMHIIIKNNQLLIDEEPDKNMSSAALSISHLNVLCNHFNIHLKLFLSLHREAALPIFQNIKQRIAKLEQDEKVAKALQVKQNNTKATLISASERKLFSPDLAARRKDELDQLSRDVKLNLPQIKYSKQQIAAFRLRQKNSAISSTKVEADNNPKNILVKTLTITVDVLNTAQHVTSTIQTSEDRKKVQIPALEQSSVVTAQNTGEDENANANTTQNNEHRIKNDELNQAVENEKARQKREQKELIAARKLAEEQERALKEIRDKEEKESAHKVIQDNTDNKQIVVAAKRTKTHKRCMSMDDASLLLIIDEERDNAVPLEDVKQEQQDSTASTEDAHRFQEILQMRQLQYEEEKKLQEHQRMLEALEKEIAVEEKRLKEEEEKYLKTDEERLKEIDAKLKQIEKEEQNQQVHIAAQKKQAEEEEKKRKLTHEQRKQSIKERIETLEKQNRSVTSEQQARAQKLKADKEEQKRKIRATTESMQADQNIRTPGAASVLPQNRDRNLRDSRSLLAGMSMPTANMSSASFATKNPPLQASLSKPVENLTANTAAASVSSAQPLLILNQTSNSHQAKSEAERTTSSTHTNDGDSKNINEADERIIALEKAADAEMRTATGAKSHRAHRRRAQSFDAAFNTLSIYKPIPNKEEQATLDPDHTPPRPPSIIIPNRSHTVSSSHAAATASIPKHMTTNSLFKQDAGRLLSSEENAEIEKQWQLIMEARQLKAKEKRSNSSTDTQNSSGLSSQKKV